MKCYLLAGGRSSRMGRSKLEIEFGGATFLDRTAAAARAVFDEVIAVQRPDGDAVPGLRTIFEPPHEDAAPIFGVLAALRDARAKCFVLAVDYPLIDAGVLRYLRDRCELSKAALLVPRWQRKLQVLCAGYASEIRPLVAARVAERRYDLRAFAAEAEIVEEEEIRARFPGEPLMNVNTPEDLEAAVKLA